MAAQMAAIY